MAVRWVRTLATGAMLAVSSFPFVVLAPEPPAFGRGAVLIVVAIGVLAILGTSWQADLARQAAIMHRAATMLAVTLAAVALHIVAAGHVASIPTMDLIALSRPLGAEVPVAYQTQDPKGTARADTFWADWSNMMGMLWIGLGFTLAPFFGSRAEFQAGRW